jgi:uncharacterized protein
MDKKFDFESLRQKLETEHSFPTVYMFKFIVPADNRKIALVESLFNEEAEISQKQSSKGSYFSLTAKQVVISAEDIISVYEKASEIEGLMAL